MWLVMPMAPGKMGVIWITFLAFWFVFNSTIVADHLASSDFENEDLKYQEPHLRARRESGLPKPNITSYHIISTVTARFVSTSVLVTATNDAETAQEVVFAVVISENAFVTGFVMTVDGIPYVATIQEKEAAQKAYNEARRRGQGAAQVRQKERSTRRFFVDLNLAANSTALFNLTYQEMLRRDKGQFKHKINVAPGQVVEDFRIEVSIIEPQGLASVSSTWSPQSSFVEPSVSYYPSSPSASVLLTPSKHLQSKISNTIGLNGDLEVTYDVIHPRDGGDLQIVNGYFVHHISPEGLQNAPKKVIFVIDVSGSMSGDKLDQTKEAMLVILSQLRHIDYFNMVFFSGSTYYWKKSVVRATPENIRDAKKFVNKANAFGGTNIHGSLIESADQFYTTDDAFAVVVFLTDGTPTVGVRNNDQIVLDVTQAFNNKISLFSLGFGYGVDDNLLGKLSAENHGVYRKIFHDSSAALQMQNFFDEVASPLLFNVAIQYRNDAVDTKSLTGDNLIAYFDGGEMVVAGKVSDDFKGTSLKAVVRAGGRTKRVKLRASKDIDQVLSPDMVEDFTQRMWAYLTIKDLLAKMKLSTVPREKAALKGKALNLSLKYSFVTPLTSLLVIKPPDLEKVFTTPSPTTLPLIPEVVDAPEVVTSYGGSSRKTNSAYGDPHIIIQDPHSNMSICFDIHGPQGMIVNLVEDTKLGITVNGEMIEKFNSTTITNNKPLPSFFGRIAIHLEGDWIVVSHDGVLVNKHRHLKWIETPAFQMVGNHSNCMVALSNPKILTITCYNGIIMKILRHKVFNGNADHFDFMLIQGEMFSSHINGIIGQFQRRQMRLDASSVRVTKHGKEKAMLVIDDTVVNVRKICRRSAGECWTSYDRQNLPMLELPYEEYVLLDLFAKPQYI